VPRLLERGLENETLSKRGAPRGQIRKVKDWRWERVRVREKKRRMLACLRGGKKGKEEVRRC